MEFSELTLKLLIIFFPGIITTLFYDRLTSQPRKTAFLFLIYSFVFGMSTYLILAIVTFIKDNVFLFFPLVFDISATIDKTPVLWATLIAFPLVLLLSYISNNKLIYRLVRKINCSKQTGYHSIWEEFFDSPDVQYVTVRDIINDFMYQGWVESFSQAEEDREIIIRDVYMFKNRSGEGINEVPIHAFLLSIPKDNGLIIEVTKFEKGGEVLKNGE